MYMQINANKLTVSRRNHLRGFLMTNVCFFPSFCEATTEKRPKTEYTFRWKTWKEGSLKYWIKNCFLSISISLSVAIYAVTTKCKQRLLLKGQREMGIMGSSEHWIIRLRAQWCKRSLGNIIELIFSINIVTGISFHTEERKRTRSR